MFLINHSVVINKIYQSLCSTMDIFVSSVIYAERYSGKTEIVKKVYKNSFWVDGSNLQDIQKALKEHHYIVITNFEKISDLDSLNFENVNVVAIYNSDRLSKRVENKFAFIYHIPPLIQREDDIKVLADYYTQEAKEIFNVEKDIIVDSLEIDVSKNLKSLKSSIYKNILLNNLDKDDLSYLLYHYFLKNYDGNSVYKEQIELFEKVLIEAGLELYKSQLKLSDVLGINRNTLRKKINEYL